MNAIAKKIGDAPAVAGAKRQRAKRMPADARKSVILKEAADFFARFGFNASTRDLADRIGVRQALLYKYYASKETLIEAIFDEVHKDRSRGEAYNFDRNRARPLADRILQFYQAMATLADGAGTRLLSRAALEDLPVAGRMSRVLVVELFRPVLDELRELERLPTLESRPMMVGEFEMMMGFHAGAMYADMRRHFQIMPAPEDAAALLHLWITTFIAGARATLRDLHAAGAVDSMSRAFAPA